MSRAAQLLSGRQPSRPRADNCYFFISSECRHFRTNPTFFEASVHNTFFNLLDGDRWLVDAEHTCRLTRRRTDTSGKLGKVVGSMQPTDCLFPHTAVHQVIPVRNDVV